MQIELPDAVEEIISRLNAHGYEASAVGGCVRDSLLGRKPEDWDITTSARPEQVKKIFPRTIDTGIAHGTVTIMIHKVGYEVTTYRIDGEYEDGRHPKEVQFTSNLIEDLKRRDFTINAMAYSSRDGIVDAFGGIEDLKAGLIRCVGNPIDRFTEDALRILRAVRFSAQLGFAIEPETYQAISVIAPNLEHVSKERILAELGKLLVSNHPDRIGLVYETGMAPFISPDFAQVKRPLPTIDPQLPAKKHLRWAAFLQNETDERAVRILRQLKSDNDTINKVRTLLRFVKTPLMPKKAELRKIMSQMTPELYDDLLLLRNVDPKGEIVRLTEEIRQDGDCLYLKQLAVSGRDLMDAGIGPGKKVGETLSALLDLVLERPEYNQKEKLISLALEKV
ncbi:MAG: CCA tRNA nucleotidyltransferase [Lachnospiraceae bacterium]|jgi:tRNA nucleotidyltransferase (CCA-adding enzyme)